MIEKAEQLLDNAKDKEDMVDMIEAINDAITADGSKILTESMEQLSDIIYCLLLGGSNPPPLGGSFSKDVIIL